MAEYCNTGAALTDVGHDAHSSRSASAAPSRWQALYLVVIFSVLATHLDLYLNYIEWLPLNPVTLLTAICVLGVPFLVWPKSSAEHLPRILDALRLNAWPIVLFFLWLLGHVVFLGSARLESSDTDFTHVFPVIQFGLVIVGLVLGTMPSATGAVRRAALVAFFLLCATMFYDVFVPMSFSLVHGRSAGFVMNPNDAAFCVLALLTFSLRWGRPSVFNLLLLVISLAATLGTFSRSGLILWVVVFLVYVISLLHSNYIGSTAVVLLGMVLSTTALVVWVVPSTPLMDIPEVKTRLSRLTLETKLIDGGDSRVGLLFHYLKLVQQRPVLGYGTGAMDRELWRTPFLQGPHNMYLRAWLDHGLWGILTYLAMLASATVIFLRRRDSRGVCFMALVWICGFFSHTLIDDKTFLLLFGIALALSTPGELQKKLEPGNASPEV